MHISVSFMSEYLTIHPENPQNHFIQKAVAILMAGGVIAYPTDSGYALGCQLGDKHSLEKMRHIRKLKHNHNFTLICSSLSDVGTYARFETPVYRLLKANTPGSYTFILKASREVPKRILHPKRRTIGIRVPEHNISQYLLKELGEPLLTTTLILPDEERPMNDPEKIATRLNGQVALIIDGGISGTEPTTVIKLTDGEIKILREGKGDTTPFI